jgi:hypothetical protein
VIPRGSRTFNGLEPTGDAAALPVVLDPEVPKLFDLLPGISRRAAAQRSVTIFLTGIPGINQPPGVRASEIAAPERRGPADIETRSPRRPRGRRPGLPEWSPDRRRRADVALRAMAARRR